MIAFEVDAFEVDVEVGSSDVSVIEAMHSAGIRSFVKSMEAKPVYRPTDLEGRCFKVLGVGDVAQEPAVPGVVRRRAFAVFAPDLRDVHDLAKSITRASLWRSFSCKIDHLPCLREHAHSGGERGRWFVCYASEGTPLPDGVNLARRIADQK